MKSHCLSSIKSFFEGDLIQINVEILSRVLLLKSKLIKSSFFLLFQLAVEEVMEVGFFMNFKIHSRECIVHR